MSDLSNILINKKSSCKELEKIIGRLNHAGSACPLTRYYISGPRKMLEHWNKSTVNPKVKKNTYRRLHFKICTYGIHAFSLRYIKESV